MLTDIRHFPPGVLNTQVSAPVKDKLEFLGRSLAINPLSSRSDSSLFIYNYSSVSSLEYLSSSSKDLQFQGTHRNLSRSSRAWLVLRGNRIAYQASSVEARRGQLDPLSGAESLGCEWPWQPSPSSFPSSSPSLPATSSPSSARWPPDSVLRRGRFQCHPCWLVGKRSA